MYRSNRLFAKETTPDDNTPIAPRQSEEDEVMKIIFGAAVVGDNATTNDAPSSAAAEKSEKTTPARKKRTKDDIDRVVEYLQRRHGIVTPEDFVQTLGEERAIHYSSSPFTVPRGTIDAIVEACDLWTPYIAPESFSNLVCEQVKSMFRLRASAICYTNSGAELNAYIGHFATLVEKPPLGFSCSVNYYGKVLVNGV